MKREQILFVVTLLFLSLMTWSLLDSEASRARRRGAGGLGLDLPHSTGETSTYSLEGQGRSARDLLRRPSADTPLQPLSLPAPPLPKLATLMPPPVPDAGPDLWSMHLHQYAKAPLGDLSDLVDTSSSADSAEEEAGFLTEDLEGVFDTDEDYAQSYDSVVIDDLTTLWGRIVNDNRYALEGTPELNFVEVNPTTGEDRNFGERTIEAATYMSFAFADTLRNRIELAVRKWRSCKPGRVVHLRAYVRQLLLDGMQDSLAFGYAEELARLAIQLAPDELENYLILGEVWERTFALDEAFALYATLAGEKLTNAMPDLGVQVDSGRFASYAAPRVAMARVLRRFALMEEAESQLRLAMASQSSDALTMASLGVLLLDEGRAAEAEPMLERSEGLLRHSPNPSDSLVAGLALGRSRLALGDWEGASSAYRSVWSAASAMQAPEQADARAGLVSALYLSGDFEAAATEASDAVTELGSQAKLLYLRGITQAAVTGSAAEVVRDLRAAASSAPLDAAVPLSALAYWLDILGERDDAQLSLDRALELQPDLPYALYLSAIWAAREGDTLSARETLRQFVSAYPECVTSLTQLGLLLAQDGSQSAAEVAYARAEAGLPDWVNSASSAPQWAPLLLQRGWNQLQMRDYEGARASFARALSLDDNLHSARNATATALYEEGDLPAAVSEWSYLQDRLREDPEHVQAQYAALWQLRTETHDQMRRWTDPFDGDRLRPGWDAEADARLGVEPRVLDGQLLIRGQHREAGKTRVFRRIPALAFNSYDADLQVGSNHIGSAGLFLALANRRAETWAFRVYRDRDGALNWAWQQGAKSESGRLSQSWPSTHAPRMGFELDREQIPPVMTVTFEGSVIWEDKVPALRSSSGQLMMGVFGETGNALPVDVALDNAELVYKKL